MELLNRVLLRKNKSLCACRACEGSPPCYDCTFNLKHPPPCYTTVLRQYPHTHRHSAHVHTQDHVYQDTPEANAHVHSEEQLYQDTPLATMTILADPDYDITTVAHGIGRIGLAILSGGQGEAVEDEEEVRERRRYHSDTPAHLRAPPHSTIERNSSAPQLHRLDLSEPQGTQEPQEDQDTERRSPSPHLLLSALTLNHAHAHTRQPIQPSEASPLPSLLLVPD